VWYDSRVTVRGRLAVCLLAAASAAAVAAAASSTPTASSSAVAPGASRYAISLRTDRAFGLATQVGQGIPLVAVRRPRTQLLAGESFGIGVKQEADKEYRIFRRCSGERCEGRHVPRTPGTWQYRAFVFVGTPPLTAAAIRGRSNVVTGVFIPKEPKVILRVNQYEAINKTIGRAGGVGQQLEFPIGTLLDLHVTTNVGVLPNGWELLAWHTGDPWSGDGVHPQFGGYYLWCHLRGGDPQTECRARRPSANTRGTTDFIQAELFDANRDRVTSLILIVPV
jgi:hypothetical protein